MIPCRGARAEAVFALLNDNPGCARCQLRTHALQQTTCVAATILLDTGPLCRWAGGVRDFSKPAGADPIDQCQGVEINAGYRQWRVIPSPEWLIP